jgi:hypothetical protein
MRHSNQLARGRRLPPLGAAGLAITVTTAVLVACGGAAPSASQAPVPTPVITPDPHLHEPVTADQIFIALGRAKLGMVANNANSETGDPAIVKLINCEIAGWPLRITQYASTGVLLKATHWKVGSAPGSDEAPYSIAGLNILIEFGPISARPPSTPDPSRQAMAAKIVAVLDPLLWPLDQHSIIDIPSRTPEPTATPAPSKAPTKTPKPSAKPTPKPTPKP